jgi:hypothetical protein
MHQPWQAEVITRHLWMSRFNLYGIRARGLGAQPAGPFAHRGAPVGAISQCSTPRAIRHDALQLRGSSLGCDFEIAKPPRAPREEETEKFGFCSGGLCCWRFRDFRRGRRPIWGSARRIIVQLEHEHRVDRRQDLVARGCWPVSTTASSMSPALSSAWMSAVTFRRCATCSWRAIATPVARAERAHRAGGVRWRRCRAEAG